MTGDDADRRTTETVIVGGGPAGASAAVFCARAGIETLVFDRGRSSLKRCAHLENYLGFPGGIDVETFYELARVQLREAGAELVSDLVESVTRTDTGFRVETQQGRVVETDRVVAAAKYDADYLRPLGTQDAMFTTHEHDGESEAYFDREYPDDDGRTPIEGLYVAGPLAGVTDQAIVAAGHGATVARTLIADARREDGYWDAVADRIDWVRREAELDDEWTDRERWREWFDSLVPDDLDRDAETVERIRETVIDEKLAAYVSETERNRRAERGHRRLAGTLDDAALVDGLDDPMVVLDSLDDDTIRSYLDES
ncbi:FAD-dependent oxidoreductase [Halorientalis regularis]|uniref:Pyridine nucleotide-disulphide oxidoreductase n=1 Tax=Halorientalis regularis TaxID=660518 RepID=A0A1G7R6C5_9EURY|nr:FAD-dependent oxidoreductase [Halorientalis regularis]SDG06293.1 Pyridine nucleotide-disulphide oxidoreductase [Halorientalis regularis]